MKVQNTPEENNGWEVSTACDIGLGRHFQTGGDYEGHIINVDRTAILQTVESIGAEKSVGRIAFIAADITSDDYTYDGDTTQGYCEVNKKNNEIVVSIGINNWSIKDILRYLKGAHPSTLEAKKMKSRKRLQKNSVHELCHAVDFSDDTLVEINKREVSTSSTGIIGSMLSYRKRTVEKRARRIALKAPSYPNIISIDILNKNRTL